MNNSHETRLESSSITFKAHRINHPSNASLECTTRKATTDACKTD